MSRTRADAKKEQLTVMTQKEVARILGLTTMRVCQIEREALAKLRREFQRLKVRP